MKYTWFKGPRSTKSMMNIIFVLLAKKAFCNVVECMNSKIFCSLCLCFHRKPQSFSMNNVINLLVITCAISCTFRRESSCCPLLRYFYFLFSCMTCCSSPLLELARQPLSVPFAKLQHFNFLHPPPHKSPLKSIPGGDIEVLSSYNFSSVG